jgi:hypothetical protein
MNSASMIDYLTTYSPTVAQQHAADRSPDAPRTHASQVFWRAGRGIAQQRFIEFVGAFARTDRRREQRLNQESRAQWWDWTL